MRKLMSAVGLAAVLAVAAGFAGAQEEKKDKKGPGAGFGFPRPGQVLPDFVQGRLDLTAEQKKQVEELQKEVDAKLAKILTDEQEKKLHDRPRGFGPFGGKDGPFGGPKRGFGGSGDRPRGPDRDEPAVTINIYMTPGGPVVSGGAPKGPPDRPKKDR